MPRLGLGLGLGRASGGAELAGGTLAAVSGTGTFEAIGGTWTLGDLSPVLWCRAGEGITVGATEATIQAAADWTGSGTNKSTDGDWTRFTNQIGTLEHHAYGLLADAVALHPIAVSLHVRRGQAPPGAASNVVRVYYGVSTAYADFDIDAGTVVSSAADTSRTPTIVALGATPDDGYAVTAGFVTAATVKIAMLVGGSPTYDDPAGSGYFRVKTAAVAQQRAAAWKDCREGVDTVWEQSTDAKQPAIYTDDHGPCLALYPATVQTEMSCHALAALGGGGGAPPLTIAVAFETEITPQLAGLVTFKKSADGKVLEVLQNQIADRINFYRNRDANASMGIVAVPQSVPYSVAAVMRFSGTAVLGRVSGTDGDPAAFDGAFTPDQLWMGSSGGAGWYRGRIREVAIWDSSLSDANAIAVDAYLRAYWGY